MASPANLLWTGERLEQLKALAGQKYTALKIAGIMGTSRSAIAAAARRHLGKGALDGAPSNGAIAKHIAAGLPRLDKAASVKKPKPEACRPVQSPPPARECFDKATVNPPLHLMNRHTCKWPMTDGPRGHVFLFCGEAVSDGKTYCAIHAAMAVAKRTPMKAAPRARIAARAFR